MAIGERLKYARERMGLTLGKVSEQVNIGVSSLSEFENNKRDPSMRQLHALAKLFRRSISFFFIQEEMPSEIMLWRQRPNAPAAEEVEAKFRTLCEQYHNLEVWCDEILNCSLPMIRSDQTRFGYPEAKSLAYKVRQSLQLGDYPGLGLLHVLEEVCNIKIFHLEFEPSGCAACTVSDKYGMAILLNKRNVRWRRNFDLAHELFHLLTWNIFRKEEKGIFASPSKEEEKFASYFASNLLMPEEVTKNAFDSLVNDNFITFSSLYDIARQFDVSMEALLWRLVTLHRLDRNKVEESIDKYKIVIPLYEERTHEEPPNRPDRFFALAIKALHSGEISLGRFAEYLEISRNDAQRYLAHDSGENEKIAVTPA